jgi:hypothetical protein
MSPYASLNSPLSAKPATLFRRRCLLISSSLILLFIGFTSTFQFPLTRCKTPHHSTHHSTRCHPFHKLGQLNVDVTNATNNYWEPFDSTCPPSTIMASLYRVASNMRTPLPLPWLLNRTVLIQGDSIDRFHLKDFCELVAGDLTVVGVEHPASPHRRVVSDGERIKLEESRKEGLKWVKDWDTRAIQGQELTSPWVCNLPVRSLRFILFYEWNLTEKE